MQRIFLLVLFFSSVNLVYAASNEPENEVALELLHAMNLASVLDGTINSMVTVEIQRNPSLAQHREAMTEFFSKYIAFENIQDEMAALYSREFSVEEMKELTDFYSTPLGQKVIATMPDLEAAVIEQSIQRIQQNIQELQKIIQNPTQNEEAE